jgi:uncharacterized OB-fold protein
LAKLQPLSGASLRVTVNPTTQPFWDATREGKLLAARCVACGTYRIPYLPFCRNCAEQPVQWEPITCAGRLFSFTVYSHPEEDPASGIVLAPALVTFEQAPGVRYSGNLVGGDSSEIQIGMPVSIHWTFNPQGWGLPLFAIR